MNQTEVLKEKEQSNKRGISFKKIKSKNEMKLRFMQLMKKSNKLEPNDRPNASRIRFKSRDQPKPEPEAKEDAEDDRVGPESTPLADPSRTRASPKQSPRADSREFAEKLVFECGESRVDGSGQLKVFCSFESEEKEVAMNSRTKQDLARDIQRLVFEGQDCARPPADPRADDPQQAPLEVRRARDSGGGREEDSVTGSNFIVTRGNSNETTGAGKRVRTAGKRQAKRAGSSRKKTKARQQSGRSSNGTSKSRTRNSRDIIRRNIENIAKIKEKKLKRTESAKRIKLSREKSYGAKSYSCKKKTAVHLVTNECSIALNSGENKKATLNRIAKKIMGKTKHATNGGTQKIKGFEATKRLYQLSVERRKRLKSKTKQVMRTKLLRELEACTFTPTINPVSVKYIERMRRAGQGRHTQSQSEWSSPGSVPREEARKGLPTRTLIDTIGHSSKLINVFLKKKRTRTYTQTRSNSKVQAKPAERVKAARSNQQRKPAKKLLQQNRPKPFKKSLFFKKVIEKAKKEQEREINVKELLEQRGMPRAPRRPFGDSAMTSKTSRISSIKLRSEVEAEKTASFALTERISEILGLQASVVCKSFLISQLKQKKQGDLSQDNRLTNHKIAKHAKEESETPVERGGLVKQSPLPLKLTKPVAGVQSQNTTILKTFENHRSIIDNYIARLEKCKPADRAKLQTSAF